MLPRFLTNRTTAMLVLAAVIGLVAAGLAVLYLKAREAALLEELRPRVKQVAVVVAKQDLPAGTVISTSNMAVMKVKPEQAHPESISPDQFDTVKGRYLAEPLASGRQLLRSQVTGEFPQDFSDTVPVKRRAMTIQVDEINSFSGLLRPGDRIDLFANLPPAVSGGQIESSFISPVVQNVEVLATGKEAARDYRERMLLIEGGVRQRVPDQYTNITVNVTPREAALLAAAQDKGDLIALLRNRKDDGKADFERMTPQELLAYARQQAEEERLRRKAEERRSMSVEQGEDGRLVTASGVKLKADCLKLDANGDMINPNGVNLNAIEGLNTNDEGEFVTASGKVVDPCTFRVNKDGVIVTEGGEVLVGKGGRKLEPQPIDNGDGTVTLPNGQTVAEENVIRDANGKVIGVRDPETGTVTLNNGKKVPADSLVIDPETGAVVGVKGPNGKVNVPGVGEVPPEAIGKTRDGAPAVKLTCDKKGVCRTPDGKVVDPSMIERDADGNPVVSMSNLAKKAEAEAGAQSSMPAYIELIIGGSSKDGAAKVTNLPVLK
ncbi:MAG: Flp pilus assembly protein CpaB [Gammaproteobacteria bacterium]|nr:MAG: Flp pilus assembly protein CpaB [Gammaproteobacteria bacterium]